MAGTVIDQAQETLAYFRDTFSLDVGQRVVEIPNRGRQHLPQWFNDLGFRCGVEVGTESGAYAETICQAMPGVHLTCVDLWQPYIGYRDHVSAKHLEGFYEETQRRLAPYQVTIIRDWSVSAAAQFEDESLDFVYIDGNHSLPHVIGDLAAWSQKVRRGGIVSGHDYARHRWPNLMHVEQGIGAWVDAYDIRPLFLIGRKQEIPGEIRDGARSWFFVASPRPAWRKGKIKQ